MKPYTFGTYQAEIDLDMTRAWYQSASKWGCECEDCRHFTALAERGQLPAEVMTILHDLAIPPEKATYVCSIYPTENGNLYQFSYRLVGNILSEGEKEDNAPVTIRCCHEPYPYGAPHFPAPHFDLEFWAELPSASETLLL